MILAVDPGKHACGVAWFHEGKLLSAKYVKSEDLPNEISHLAGVVTELHLERQYLTKNHPRPGDIVDLAFAAGVVKGLVQAHWSYAKIVEHLPVQWKGNVPKPIMAKRILAKLDPNEVARIQRVGYKDHNTLDAIGIGLFALKRI